MGIASLCVNPHTVHELVEFGFVTGGLEGMKITDYVPYGWYRVGTTQVYKSRSSKINQQFDLDPADIAIHAPSLHGRKLTAAVAFVAGTGFTLLGYDQGVMSSLITGNQFEATFPEVVVEASHPNHATLHSFTTAIYGCLFGALSNLWLNSSGAILQTTAFSFAHLIFARIFTGCGTGLLTSTVPTYHAELSPSAKRGRMIMMEGTLIVAGAAIAFFVNWSSAQWRVPISLQLVFEIIVVTCIEFLPGSPKWLVNHGRNAEAMAVISAMEDKPPPDPEVQRTYYGIREAVAVETSTGQGSLRELITGGRSQNFRRTVIAVLTGINLTILFQRLGLSDTMLIGAIGQYLVMLLLAILGYINNGPAQIVSVVLLFGFNAFFAIGWLGMAWLYCAELAGLRTRAQANALSTGLSLSYAKIILTYRI
ncbi:uncharacterized protein F5891DRAFT_1131629 [Suillus fuscotomentosus]|uniref:Major facilitator superfamily (MFS) profile domain-containing protein n=1 Tax=Suillus fuscotomentosus TaxID=1912939 RepID=A0AAD4DSE2_9AGAM|nr:uncharacterized protein F5891DRAFT_1131629 [Suillus fuscotomentosus]KAG1890589.1 hypothetical protein F5891DRAFT_1131629 [Suillus fuscotomentosus]